MSSSWDQYIALSRFGYGPDREEGLGFYRGRPLDRLIDQITDPRLPKHLTDHGGIELSYKFLSAARKNKTKELVRLARKAMRDNYMGFVYDLFLHRQKTDQPFIERLCAFWSNHFTVSIDKPVVLGLLRDYEYTAIRPYITGRFADMLIAVASHPAMLLYLDNAQSFGPNTLFARFAKRGLNENLAREILELHTIGVDAGYSQHDVIAFAKMLTGWSLELRQNRTPYPKFHFHARGHEPGPKTLLGRTYKEDGINEAKAALSMLATHPRTARRLATKMARHFISDKPSSNLIMKMEQAFLRGGGDLFAMTQAMLRHSESWLQDLRKVKTTPDYIVSSFRALGFQPKEFHTVTSLHSLDYLPFKAPDPQGFSDDNSYWAAPGALVKRAEWAQEAAVRIKGKYDPFMLGKQLFGPYLSNSTAFALKGAESQSQGLTLLLMSPEFQRR
ncbi:MAG: DUF1800 domain-containing protein [Rhodospirillales bacterium]|nr:DUF1800 domain-containing protein [Rhodospirillales bacterium]